jgi:hypothetical protein
MVLSSCTLILKFEGPPQLQLATFLVQFQAMAATSVASGSRAAGLSCVCKHLSQGSLSNKNSHSIPILSRDLIAERLPSRRTNNPRSQQRLTEIRTIGQFEHGYVSRSRRGGVRASVGLGSDNGPTNDGNVKEFFNGEFMKQTTGVDSVTCMLALCIGSPLDACLVCIWAKLTHCRVSNADMCECPISQSLLNHSFKSSN